uniref:Transmembrane protein n=1 Tax=Anopheles coluzzii TaxID=1518534 RepID=A0A8W7PAY9_ANOCL
MTRVNVGTVSMSFSVANTVTVQEHSISPKLFFAYAVYSPESATVVGVMRTHPNSTLVAFTTLLLQTSGLPFFIQRQVGCGPVTLHVSLIDLPAGTSACSMCCTWISLSFEVKLTSCDTLAVPAELTARHSYTPQSAGAGLWMHSWYTPFGSRLISSLSPSTMSSPSFCQLIVGFGRPCTFTSSTRSSARMSVITFSTHVVLISLWLFFAVQVYSPASLRVTPLITICPIAPLFISFTGPFAEQVIFTIAPFVVVTLCSCPAHASLFFESRITYDSDSYGSCTSSPPRAVRPPPASRSFASVLMRSSSRLRSSISSSVSSFRSALVMPGSRMYGTLSTKSTVWDIWHRPASFSAMHVYRPLSSGVGS